MRFRSRCAALVAAIALASPCALAQNQVTVTISPTSVSIPVGGDRQFTATVSGSSNRAVTWAVNGVAGGNPTVGTISATGLYHAPAAPPVGYAVTVRATGESGTIEFEAIVRIDTPEELVAFRHGGILPYVLRQLVGRS